MYRTDVQYVNGKIQAKPTGSADVRKALPEVKLTDRLASTGWSASIKSELAQYGYDNDPLLSSALNAQKNMAELAQQFSARRGKQNPTETQYVHLKRLSDDYSKAIKQVAEQNDRARNSLKNRLSDVQREFEQSMKFDMRDASDIRKALREANKEQRSEYIAQAVESGDGNLLAVIINSHPITTGINAEMQLAYRSQAINKHRPDLSALERNLKKTDQLIFDSFTDLLTLGNDLTAKNVRDQYETEIAAAKALEVTQF